MIGDLLADGTDVVPGIGSDIAEPGVDRDLLSGNAAGAADLLARRRCRAAGRPLRRADDAAAAVHVAPGPCRRSARRASTSPRTYGGDVDHRWLERSYHVATLDYDRDDIIAAAVEFALRLTAATAEPVWRARDAGSGRCPGIDRRDRARRAAQPRRQLARHRSAVAQRLRADDRPRHPRRRVAVRPAHRGAWPGRARRRRSDRRSGQCSPASSGPACTT